MWSKGNWKSSGAGEGTVKLMGHDDEWLFPHAWCDVVSCDSFFGLPCRLPTPLPLFIYLPRNYIIIAMLV